MDIPDGLYYTKDHEWARLEDNVATVGITDHAQEQLGDITYVELPATGTEVEQFGELAVVESVKAASDLFAPLGGTVAEVNDTLEDTPGKVNAEPYGEGWICKITGVNSAELANLMSAKEYEALIMEDN